jgi:hypothetical protein
MRLSWCIGRAILASVRLTIDVPDHIVEAIDRAAEERYGVEREVLLAELFDRVRDGFARPGSWEATHVERLLAGLTFRSDERTRVDQKVDDLDDSGLESEDDGE